MKTYRATPSLFAVSSAGAHFKAGSALSEFIAGRLGAPSCWPRESHRASAFLRLPEEVLSIQRWENEGGRAVAPSAPGKRPMSALQHFPFTQPFLTQAI